MTRQQYEQTYGVKTPAASSSPIDTMQPAPVRMTLEEYNQKYGGMQPGQTKRQILVSQLNPFKLLNPVHHAQVTSDIPNDLKSIFTGMWESAQYTAQKLKDTKQDYQSGKIGFGSAFTKTVGTGLAGMTDIAIAQPFMGVLKIPFTPEQEKQIGRVISESAGDAIGAIGEKYRKTVQDLSYGTEEEQDVAEFLRSVESKYKEDPNFKAYVDGTGGIAIALTDMLGFRTGKGAVKEGFSAAGDAAKRSENLIESINTNLIPTGRSNVARVASEIDKIESKYVNTRKAKTYESDAGEASRLRIAESNVLSDAIDSDGLLQTKVKGGAYDEYRRRYIEPYESVVRDNLKREGTTINVKEIENALKVSLGTNPNLVGGDLASALKSIKREIEGLKLWADELGNIPLYKLHDAKIAEAKMIDFNTPASVKTVRKAKAATYKDLVERKSSTEVNVEGKVYDVAGINKELKKFYDDLDRLELLDGKRVQGGKLGKYTSQLAGNIAGGALGSSGGAAGMALGSVLGGEVASGLKGVAMRRTLKGKSVPVEKNKVLEAAKKMGESSEIDLRKPNQPISAPQGVPRTKEIIKVERDIRNNVKAQKAAIKANDFELVKMLKEIYQSLVAKLNELVKAAKDNLNTPTGRGGGYALNKPKDFPKGKADPDLKTKREVSMKDVAGNKFTVPEGTVLKPKVNDKGQAIVKVGNKEYTVPKNQYDNLKGQSDRAVAEPFAPELEGTKVTVRGAEDMSAEARLLMEDEIGEGLTFEEALEQVSMNAESNVATKYDQYTLPGGKDYREILVQAPEKTENLDEMSKKMFRAKFYQLTESEQAQVSTRINHLNQSENYKSSHWEEPNVLFHLRMNDRTWNGKKVTFMEELQSDWARDGRGKGFLGTPVDTKGWTAKKAEQYGEPFWKIEKADGEHFYYLPYDKAKTAKEAIEQSVKTKETVTQGAVPNNPLLKNWQIPATKKALLDAVERDADVFAWINGAQTSERYKLSTQVEKIRWDNVAGDKVINIDAKQGDVIQIEIDDTGTVIKSEKGDWKGKRLDEVLGKGMADSIMSKQSGTLEGEGLNFGGEWAHNLYDKQVRDIVKKLTGAEVKQADMGLGTKAEFNVLDSDSVIKKLKSEYTDAYFANPKYKKDLEKAGGDVDELVKEKYPDLYKSYKESNTQTQQYIELTPEVKAKIKSEAPKFKMKNPSAGDALPLILLMLGGGAVAMEG